MSFIISLVKYLNSAPLGWGFTHGPLRDKATVLLSTPAECADQLNDGRADAGLIPVVEYQRIPGLRIIPGISIATQGKARSVLLVSRVRAEEIHTVALDSSSRTSAVLVQVLLAHMFDARPDFKTSLPDLKEMLTRNDAALIIGDPALSISSRRLYVYDLGELWVRMTGMPFVFAFWAVRPSEEAARLAPLFDASRSYGLERLEEICRHYAPRMPMTVEDIRHYLTANIDFDLGPSHVAGLELFFRMAAEQDLLQVSRPLEFLVP